MSTELKAGQNAYLNDTCKIVTVLNVDSKTVYGETYAVLHQDGKIEHRVHSLWPFYDDLPRVIETAAELAAATPLLRQHFNSESPEGCLRSIQDGWILLMGEPSCSYGYFKARHIPVGTLNCWPKAAIQLNDHDDAYLLREFDSQQACSEMWDLLKLGGPFTFRYLANNFGFHYD